MSLQVHKSVLNERIDAIARSLSVDRHQAMLRLVYSLDRSCSIDALDGDSIIDGNGEYKIDVLDIDDGSDEELVTVSILQATTSESLSSNAIKCMGAGLEYLFIEPRARYVKLVNERFRE